MQKDIRNMLRKLPADFELIIKNFWNNIQEFSRKLGETLAKFRKFNEKLVKFPEKLRGLFNKDWEQFWKRPLFSKLFSITTAPSWYSSLSVTYFSQYLCYSSNTCWNLFHIKRLRVISTAHNAVCRDSKRRPLRSLLPAGNRKKITASEV